MQEEQRDARTSALFQDAETPGDRNTRAPRSRSFYYSQISVAMIAMNDKEENRQ
jgi:hypothetical protein